MFSKIVVCHDRYKVRPSVSMTTATSSQAEQMNYPGMGSGVTVIVPGKGVDNTSSNSGRSCLNFTKLK